MDRELIEKEESLFNKLWEKATSAGGANRLIRTAMAQMHNLYDCLADPANSLHNGESFTPILPSEMVRLQDM